MNKDLIKANIIDIRNPKSLSTSKMLVDSNILYFCYYDRFQDLEFIDRAPKKYQLIEYPKYYEIMLSSKIELFIHKISIIEFVKTVIEAEMQIAYCKSDPTLNLDNYKPKYFRVNNPQTYYSVQQNILTYLASIKKTFKMIGCDEKDITLDMCLSDFYLTWQKTLADPNEAIMIADANKLGICSVFSDDFDIATFKSINFYTANRKVV